ncbi:hypothetical protein NIES592_22940 [Fischerella major NIES-592]|uniref:HEAT repeat domain-containing protein n=1 Tax=Fischerella major NIES-592 TaxID=210994 RepID=A0A1U7GT69_9CYAN|nr:hypothetical protein [Fischerella major]OKH11095.1 hypothetical protein NIES592_22940 [Fischerella major NIES-592]
MKQEIFATLRGLSEQALGFDNHFLAQYKEYVFTQLPQEKPFAQLCYVKQLGQLIYPEQAIAAALKMLQNSSNAEVRFAVAETLQHYNLATN